MYQTAYIPYSPQTLRIAIQSGNNESNVKQKIPERFTKLQERFLLKGCERPGQR